MSDETAILRGRSVSSAQYVLSILTELARSISDRGGESDMPLDVPVGVSGIDEDRVILLRFDSGEQVRRSRFPVARIGVYDKSDFEPAEKCEFRVPHDPNAITEGHTEGKEATMASGAPDLNEFQVMCEALINAGFIPDREAFMNGIPAEWLNEVPEFEALMEARESFALLAANQIRSDRSRVEELDKLEAVLKRFIPGESEFSLRACRLVSQWSVAFITAKSESRVASWTERCAEGGSESSPRLSKPR